MGKVLVIFGTRPEAIKMAPVVKALRSKPDRFDVREVVTGQHREMLDQVVIFSTSVRTHDLDIMKHGQSLTDITCGVLRGLEDVIAGEKPK